MVQENGHTGYERRQGGGRWLAGLILIAIGVFALLGRFVDGELIGLAVLPGIGLAFLVAGIATRQAGFMVPAGILTGLGTGVILAEGPLERANDDVTGGIILLGLGAGFVLVTILTALLTERTFLWALIPGGILSLIGGALVVQGTAARGLLEALGWLWPLSLVAVGVWLLWRHARMPRL